VAGRIGAVYMNGGKPRIICTKLPGIDKNIIVNVEVAA